MGWIANLFLVIALWLGAGKKRTALLFTMVGESIWVIYALRKNMYDLAAICILFTLVALRGWIKWRP